MAFDVTLPADTTKIRNLGTVIRPNWVAIQDGESTFKPKAVNFNNRTVSGPSNNPTAIADTFILFSKQDAAGNPELYGINQSSNVIQLTRGTPTVAASGSTFLPGGVLLVWATSSAATGSTITVAGLTTIYSIVANTNVANAAPSISVYDVVGNAFKVRNPGTNSFYYQVIGV